MKIFEDGSVLLDPEEWNATVKPALENNLVAMKLIAEESAKENTIFEKSREQDSSNKEEV